MIKTNVCIVGAGPTGLTASMFLSKHGIDHVLIDKEIFPRHKVCGECYDGRVSRIFNEIDPAILTEMLTENIVQHTNYYSAIRKSNVFNIIYPTNKQTLRIQTDRYYFDFFLLNYVKKQKHVQVFENQTIGEIEKCDDGLIVRGRNNDFAVKTDILLMACGSDSRLSERFLGDQRPESNHHFIFLRRYFQLKKEYPNRSVTFHYVTQPFPLVFVFCPTPLHKVNVEIAVRRSDYQRYKPNLKQLVDDFLRENALMQTIFQDAEEIYAPIGTSMVLHNPARSFVGDRFMIAGDAAFSSQPTMGFGVGQAMTMGKLAALKAIEAIENQDFNASFLQSFDHSVRRRFRSEMFVGKIVTLLFARPRLLGSLLYIATSSPRFSRFLSRLLQKALA